MKASSFDIVSDSAASEKWRVMLLLSFAELLGMSVWLSASAVVPALSDEWHLGSGGEAWLTNSVQIGFVIGAFASALLNLADRVPTRLLFSLSCGLAALATLLIPAFATGLLLAIPLRLLTGLFLAGVYPVGMKIIATWTRRDRGFGIGLLVGALTVGTALPHLLRSFGDLDQWKLVLYLAALLAALGALLAAFFVREGPYQMPAPRFNWSYIGRIMSTRDLVLANIGYLGHMWELYAMWTWIPVYLAASYDKAGISSGWAPPTAFGVIAIGGAGSILAGKLADQLGRTTITIGSLLISGTSALVVGLLFGASPLILVPVVLIWGFAIVADSAQFSACVSELSEREYIGTALTLQTSMGFLLTLASIRLIPTFENWVGWSWAFAFLAIGPVFGIVAMLKLRHSASALRLAGGNR